MATKQRILLVDDHEIVRLGLKALLARHPNFEVIAEAGTAKEAVEQVETYTPDVVVMDVRLPGGSGIEACQEIADRFPQSKVIMLTSYAEDEKLFSAIRAGASGYILKQIDSDGLVKALDAVARGEALLDDLTQVTGGGHFGLRFMRERAEEVGGRLLVESTPGKGTRVVVEVPVSV